MKGKLLFKPFLAIITFTVLLSCGEDYEPIYGSLIGLVVNQNGEPVDGATILLQTGEHTFTNAEGEFSFMELLPSENYLLKVKKEGYDEKKIENISVKAGEKTTVDAKITASNRYLNIKYPKDDITFYPGYTVNILWKHNVNGSVKIELFNGTKMVSVLSSSVANKGYFNWQVPQDIDGKNFTIKITALGEDNLSSLSGVFNVSSKIPFDMVLVEGGEFTMGCRLEAKSCYVTELPAHDVTLFDYHLSKFEITQAQWNSIMGDSPAHFDGCDNCPVESVSWNDVHTFLDQLNAKYPGYDFRLPTEAEWEYAALGGKYNTDNYTYSGSNSIVDVAWYSENSGGKPHKAGSKMQNQLGIFDMTGNVSEWCFDRYGNYSTTPKYNPTGAINGGKRVIRGGCWLAKKDDCRNTKRHAMAPGEKSRAIGFRIAY